MGQDLMLDVPISDFLNYLLSRRNLLKDIYNKIMKITQTKLITLAPWIHHVKFLTKASYLFIIIEFYLFIYIGSFFIWNLL